MENDFRFHRLPIELFSTFTFTGAGSAASNNRVYSGQIRK